MNIAGKITKGVLFTVGGVVLVLFAVFIYINNDLGSSQLVKIFERDAVSKLPTTPGGEDAPVYGGPGWEQLPESDITQPQSDVELDAVFEVDEPADNFDDLVE